MSFLEKRNHLDELINIPTKAEERSMVQISFMTQEQTSRQAQSGIRAKIYSWSTIQSVFQIRESASDLRQKSTIRALFKAKSARRSQNLFTPLDRNLELII